VVSFPQGSVWLGSASVIQECLIHDLAPNLPAMSATRPRVVAGADPAHLPGLITSLFARARDSSPICRWVTAPRADAVRTSPIQRRARIAHLAEDVDVVMGVDAHIDTHNAALVSRSERCWAVDGAGWQRRSKLTPCPGWVLQLVATPLLDQSRC
jgi:hypothetical protein